jgi:uncharacterized membrane protein
MERSDLARVTAFSDGVMAVAITLLVLGIDVPKVPEAELAGQLDDLVTPVAAYALAFALVGRFWVMHHRHFEALERVDGRLMTLNLLFLGLIVLVPFSTNLMSDYSDVPEAATVFAVTIGLASLAHWLLASYSWRGGLVRRDREHLVRPIRGGLGLGFSLVFFLSIPFAYVDTTIAQVMWTGTIALRYPLRLAAGRGSRTSS